MRRSIRSLWRSANAAGAARRIPPSPPHPLASSRRRIGSLAAHQGAPSEQMLGAAFSAPQRDCRIRPAVIGASLGATGGPLTSARNSCCCTCFLFSFSSRCPASLLEGRDVGALLLTAGGGGAAAPAAAAGAAAPAAKAEAKKKSSSEESAGGEGFSLFD